MNNSLKKVTFIACFTLFFLCVVFGACSQINKNCNLEDDNFLEETFEGLIENYFDLPHDTIDLTPDSQER